METLQNNHSLCNSLTTDAWIFNDLKGFQVINSIVRLGYMLEAGNKFPTQAETVFLLFSIQGDH